MLQEAGQIQRIHFFDHSDFPAHSMFTLMYAEEAWVLVSSGTQVQPQIILDPDYLPGYPFLMTMK